MPDAVLQLPEDELPMVPRTAMPQVDEIYYPDMLVWLGDRKVSFSAGYIDPTTCHSHQLVDVAKANAMPEQLLVKPVLLSKDLCVIDGNHRWYRYLISKNWRMPFIQLELNFFEAIKLIEQYPKCYEIKS